MKRRVAVAAPAFRTFSVLFAGTLLCAFLHSPAAAEEVVVEVKVHKGESLKVICEDMLSDPGRCGEIVQLNSIANPDAFESERSIAVPVRLLKGMPVGGRVVFLEGDVKAAGPGSKEWFLLTPGDPLPSGTTVRTGEQSVLEIDFPDGSSLYLKPGATLELRSVQRKSRLYFWKHFYLKIGKVISRVKRATGSDSRWQIETPSGIAAARGTVFNVSVDTEESTRTESWQGSVVVAAMGGEVAIEAGEGTVVKKNQPPAPARKLLPPPSLSTATSLFLSLPAVVTVGGVPGAAAYRLTISRDAEFRSVAGEPLYEKDGVIHLPDLADGAYFLRSQAVDEAGLEGLPSDTLEFRVRTNPRPPRIKSPGEGSRLREKDLEIWWATEQDAVRYHLQISRDEGFTDLVEESEDLTGITHGASLPSLGRYFLRLAAVAADDFRGEWSPAVTFDIVAPLPIPIALVEHHVGPEVITLRAEDAGEGTIYHCQVALDEKFRQKVFDRKSGIPSFTLPVPAGEVYYFVRIRALNTEGDRGPYSEPISIHIRHFWPIEGSALLIILLISIMML